MYYYGKMRWELKGMSFEDLWCLEGEEARTALVTLNERTVQHLYKVIGEQYVVAVQDARSNETFDRFTMGLLPMREHLIFEDVVPLEEGYSIDVYDYLQARIPGQTDAPKHLAMVFLTWDPHDRKLEGAWPGLCEAAGEIEGAKVLSLYRMAARQGAIAVCDFDDAAGMTRFSGHPSLQGASVDKVWALRDYFGFAEDVFRHYKPVAP